MGKLRSWFGGTPSEVPPDNGTTRYVVAMARRMIKLVTSSAGVAGNLPEIRTIGERLHERGGPDRMRDLLNEVAIGGRPDLERVVEQAWNGIGDWRS
ncbi:hypothetical protein OG474_15555 [Kribbella sp. NBC_01505]|uniref:hypothetical protein n=1 Tax=Kribbella sp. NBC_01505 TaxID=2903580 RepID=UPI0038673E7B